MKIIDKSLRIAESLFPQAYASRSGNGYQAFHFAFAFERNRLLSIGQNSYIQDGSVLKFSKYANAIKRWPYPHAELACLSKLWGRHHIDSSIRLVVIRLNRYGKLQNSAPCRTCVEVLNALDVRDVWASNKNQTIERCTI